MIKLDRNTIHKFSQKNNVLDSENTCGPTNCIQAYAVTNDKEVFPKGKYTQPEDNFTDFMRNSNVMKELRKFYGLPDNDIPNNEYLKLLATGFNLYMNKLTGDFTRNYCTSSTMTLSDIRNSITHLEAVVVSVGKDKVKGHFITVIGYDLIDTGHVYIYNTYANLSIFKDYQEVDGAVKIPFPDFLSMYKGYGIVFHKEV